MLKIQISFHSYIWYICMIIHGIWPNITFIICFAISYCIVFLSGKALCTELLLKYAIQINLIFYIWTVIINAPIIWNPSVARQDRSDSTASQVIFLLLTSVTSHRWHFHTSDKSTAGPPGQRCMKGLATEQRWGKRKKNKKTARRVEERQSQKRTGSRKG